MQTADNAFVQADLGLHCPLIESDGYCSICRGQRMYNGIRAFSHVAHHIPYIYIYMVTIPRDMAVNTAFTYSIWTVSELEFCGPSQHY